MRPHEWKGESVVWAPNVTSIAVDYESGDVYYYYNESKIGCFECKSVKGIDKVREAVHISGLDDWSIIAGFSSGKCIHLDLLRRNIVLRIAQ